MSFRRQFGRENPLRPAARLLWTRSLAPAQLARVEAETLVRDLPVGVPVCRKGEPVEHWIGLIDGLVKMTSVSPEGKTTTFTGVTSGGWFGEGSLLKDKTGATTW